MTKGERKDLPRLLLFLFPPFVCYHFTKDKTTSGDISIFVIAQRLVPISLALHPSGTHHHQQPRNGHGIYGATVRTPQYRIAHCASPDPT